MEDTTDVSESISNILQMEQSTSAVDDTKMNDADLKNTTMEISNMLENATNDTEMKMSEIVEEIVNNKKRMISEDLEPVLVKIVNSSGTQGRDIHIHEDELSIGRGRDNDEIILSILISRNHCRLKRNENGDWMLTNLSSTHTFLNNVPLLRGAIHKLNVGDILQLSESSEFRYIFTLTVRCDHIAKRARMEEDALNGVVQRQKTEFAESQAIERKDLENLLALEKTKQQELKQQLEGLLNRQVTEQQDDKLKEQILALEKKIELGNIAEEELKSKYEQLLAKLEEEKRRFEEQLAEEKRKWEEALESTKREKESLEASLKVEMEEWKAKEEAEWKSKMESAVREEKSVQEKLSHEKLQLEEKMKKMEEAMKEQQTKTQTMQAELNNKEAAKEIPLQLLENCIVVEVKNSEEIQMIDTIDLTGEQPVFTVAPAVNKDVGAFNRVNDIMEEQLTCSICSELFIMATTLNCTHTFCRHCIITWMGKRKECPNCRAKIVSLNRSLVLDNFIEKMVDNFSAQHKQRRRDLIKERLAPKPKRVQTYINKRRR